MKKNAMVLVLLVSAVAIGLYAAEKGAEPKAEAPKAAPVDMDKVSYAIGMSIGKNFKEQEINVSIDRLVKGMKDAMSGAKAEMTEAEIRTTMMAFQMEMMKKAQDRNKRQGEENLAKGKTFLEENAKKKGVKVTKSGLQYIVVEEGKGDKAKATDTVAVKYRGTLIDGTEFDNSDNSPGKKVEFPVNGVIPGWTEALQLMSVGSKYKLFIPSNLAYGPRSMGKIQANSTLIFDVELLEIKKK